MIIRITACILILLVAAGTSPVFACSPVFNAAYPAMLSSWVVWLLLACFMAPGNNYIKRNLVPWFLYPISFALFMIPIPPWLAVINGIFFISFSISNIMEFLWALGTKEEDKLQRRNRLFFYGIPTLCLVIAGVVFRGLYYTSASGIMRVFMDKGILIYSVSLLAGILIYVVIDGKEEKGIPPQNGEEAGNPAD